MSQMIHDRVVQRLVPLFLADLDHHSNLIGLAFTTELGDSHVDDQNFKRRNSSGDIDSFEEILRDYALKRFGERGADLVLLISREYVDDAVDSFSRAGRMQSAKNQVSGRRGG